MARKPVAERPAGTSRARLPQRILGWPQKERRLRDGQMYEIGCGAFLLCWKQVLLEQDLTAQEQRELVLVFGMVLAERVEPEGLAGKQDSLLEERRGDKQLEPDRRDSLAGRSQREALVDSPDSWPEQGPQEQPVGRLLVAQRHLQ